MANCPVCGSDNVGQVQTFDLCELDYYIEHWCNNCGMEWETYFVSDGQGDGLNDITGEVANNAARKSFNSRYGAM